MWSVSTGAALMKRIAAPMIGGVFTSFLLELLVYPVLFELWKWHGELKKVAGPDDQTGMAAIGPASHVREESV